MKASSASVEGVTELGDGVKTWKGVWRFSSVKIAILNEIPMTMLSKWHKTIYNAP